MIWLYPTWFKELEKSYMVKKFGRTLFFPKSIITEQKEYKFGHGSKGYKGYYETTRCKFLIPQWYVDKYKIQHWDNIHRADGTTWEEHFQKEYGDILETPRQRAEKLKNNLK